VANTLTTSLGLYLSGQLYKSDSTQGDASQPVSYSVNLETTNGTGSSQTDLVYKAERTLAGSGVDTLDLSGGLTDIYGTTLAFVEVREIFIYNTSTTTGDILRLGGGSDGSGTAACFTNMFGASSSTIRIPTNRAFVWGADKDGEGMTVTATTADILRIQNLSANSVTYFIRILGCSA